MGFTFISFEVRGSRYKSNGRPRGRQVRSEPNEREMLIRDLFLNGETMHRISELQYPVISRERVRQILKKRFGLTGKDGGKFQSTTPLKIAAAIDNNKQMLRKKEIKCHKVFGCTIDVFLSINGEKWNRKRGTPAMAYYEQQRNANSRGIVWNITFPEWWKIWTDSGHYNERGRWRGYCMTRIGDTGGYEVGNVEIKTIAQNFSDSFFKHPRKERVLTAIKNGNHKQKTHCIRGHERNKFNISSSGNCKVCARIRYKEQKSII